MLLKANILLTHSKPVLQTTVNMNTQDFVCQRQRAGQGSHLFSQLVLMFCYSFLQLWNLCLLLLNDTPQVFDAVVVGQLVFGHLQAAGRWNIRLWVLMEWLKNITHISSSITSELQIFWIFWSSETTEDCRCTFRHIIPYNQRTPAGIIFTMALNVFKWSWIGLTEQKFKELLLLIQ